MTVSKHSLGCHVLVITITFLIVATARPAQCCSCMTYPREIPPREAESYSLIIDATVTSLELVDPSQNENPEMVFEADLRITVTVNRSWLGSVPGEFTLWTHSATSACGYPFKIDSSYLVFVDKGNETVSLCSRTCNIEAAGELETKLNNIFGKPLRLEPGR